MPTKKTISSKGPAKAAPAPAAADGKAVEVLEGKIASLEAQLEKLVAALSAHEAQSAKEHKALKDACDACCDAKVSGGQDGQLREELKRYFATVNSTKVRTHIPNI